MRTLVLLTFAVAVAACTGSTRPPLDVPVTVDSGVDIVVDTGPNCMAICAALATQCPRVSASDCTAACVAGRVSGTGGADGGLDAGSVARDVAQCIAAAGMACSAAEACLQPPATPAFNTGTSGTNVRDLAGDFTLPTSTGDWNFQTEWTGQDNYVFLFYAPTLVTYPNGTDYGSDLFTSAGLTPLLQATPRNVHYFFGWLRDQPGFATLQQSMQGEIDALPEPDRTWWRAHVHFITGRVDQMTNWIGTMVHAREVNMLPYKMYDPLQFAIDRTQRIREVGQLGVLVSNGLTVDISMLANEPIFYNFEWDRAQRLAAETVTTFTLATQQIAHDTIDVDVTLPDSATLAAFDTMEVDLQMDCPHHRDGECGAWDYLSYLWVCQPNTPPPGDAGTSDATPSDSASTPTYTCNTEIARWITSYWRETHWVTDISGMLPLLQPGGHTHFRWNANGQFSPRSTDYTVTLSLRLSNQGRGMHPVAAIPLWQGGGWGPQYNALHMPQSVTVPAGTRRADLYTLVTGHGGVAPSNCAEFCNHEHHFAVNGGADHLVSFPGAQTQDGCALRVNEGVTPNQHGTWYYGRGGWCPGFDVAPTIFDVTSEVHPGGTNTLTYSTTFGGRPPAVGMGTIVLSSYLVLWQ